MGVKDVILLINQRENQADVTTDSKENPKKKHICRSELLKRIYKRRQTWFFPQSGVREVNPVSTKLDKICMSSDLSCRVASWGDIL